MIRRSIVSVLSAIALCIATFTESSAATLWEGTHEIVNYNSTPLKVDKSMLSGVAAGDQLTVYFTVGTAQNYGTMDLSYGATKLACSNSKTNTKKDGNFAPDATETSVTLSEAGDIDGLKAKGLQIKGRNITISKIVLTSEGQAPEEPDPVEPTDPVEGEIWAGKVATGEWSNDVTVAADKFADAAGGYYLAVYATLSDGAGYGTLEIDDQNYTALSCDRNAPELDDYGCVKPGAGVITYRLSNSDVELLKANGLRVKGANLIITKIVLTYGDPVQDEPEPDGLTTLWKGNVNCGKWADAVSIDASAFADAKAGDKLIVAVSKNSGKSYCQPEARDGNDGKLPCSDLGDNIEDNGHLAAGAQSATYVLTDKDVELLKASGLKYTGFACTVTKVQLQKTDFTSSVADVEVEDSTPVRYYTLDGVAVSVPVKGIYIVVKGTKVSKAAF